MSSRGPEDVTNVWQENRKDKLTGDGNNAKRPGAPFPSSCPPPQDAFEPATPVDLIDRKKEPSASTTDRDSLQKVVTTRMLDAEQRLRRVLEEEGWTPSSRKNRHQFGYTPVRRHTTPPTSHQSSPNSMRDGLTARELESKLYPPTQSETQDCALQSTPPIPGRDQCQSNTKQMLPGAHCTQKDLSEEISNAASLPGNLLVIPTVDEGNGADAPQHGKSTQVNCQESHDTEGQYLHAQTRGTDYINEHSPILHSLQEHEITQWNNRQNPVGVQAYDHAAAFEQRNHQLSLEERHSVGQQPADETSSITSTDKQQKVAGLQHQEENQKYNSSAKLADQQYVAKAGTKFQSHVSMEIKTVQEPTRNTVPESVPQIFTMLQVDEFLKIMPVVFNRLEHFAGHMREGKLARQVRFFVDSIMNISRNCASTLSRWKLSRWQATIAVYIIALHVLVCYHMLQYLEHPHSSEQLYK